MQLGFWKPTLTTLRGTGAAILRRADRWLDTSILAVALSQSAGARPERHRQIFTRLWGPETDRTAFQPVRRTPRRAVLLRRDAAAGALV